MAVDVSAVVDEGLGNSAYLVDLGDGRALAIDPSRDLRALTREAARRKLTVAYAIDTHLHADFLSGALQLAHDDNAEVIASARGRRSFDHVGLDDDDEVDLGGLRLRALFTPGHTDEHLSYLLLDGSTPLGVFSGGSLIVGSAARTDLLGAERTDELARAQYRSLQRLARLGDDVALWPTHGAGSFCSAPPGAQRTSTIGTEKACNALLNATDEDSFVKVLTSSLGSYPDYFDHLGELNRRGPLLLDTASAYRLDRLTVSMVEQLREKGTAVVDARPIADYGRAHIPGAISIPLRDQFATWLGWLVPDPGTPLVFVRDADQDPEEIVWQALKIGYELVLSELAGGMGAWTAEGRPTAGVGLVDAGQLAAQRGGVEVLDVRQDSEYVAGHIPGAQHVELGALAERATQLPARPTVVMCGHGERAMGAARVLSKAGRPDIAVLTGGPEDWAEATGEALATGWRP